MPTDKLAALRKAAEGLRYRSESDAPFTPFSWGKADGDLTPQTAARLAGASAGAPVEESAIGDFSRTSPPTVLTTPTSTESSSRRSASSCRAPACSASAK